MAKQVLTGIAAPTRVTSAPKMPPAVVKTPMGPRVIPPKRWPVPRAARAVATPGRKSIQPVPLGGRKRNY